MSNNQTYPDQLPDALMSDAPPAYMRDEDSSRFPTLFEAELNAELQKSAGVSVSPTNSLIHPTPGSPGYAQESVLLRGLQVPPKSKNISSGFKYPSILERAGVSKKDWTTFTREIEQYAEMNASQWLTTLGGAAGTLVVGNLMIGFLGLVPAVIVGRKMRDRHEKQNFRVAERSGALKQCIERWNQEYFMARGLLVRVDLPGNSDDMDQMDLSTSKLFKQQSRTGVPSTEVYSKQSSQSSFEGLKAQVKEEKDRTRAARRGRIVIIPMDPSRLSTPSLSGTGYTASPALGSLKSASSEGDPFEEGVLENASEYGEEELTMFGRSQEVHKDLYS